MAVFRDIEGNHVELAEEDEMERERFRMGGLAAIVGLSTGVILGMLRYVFNLPIDRLFAGLFS